MKTTVVWVYLEVTIPSFSSKRIAFSKVHSLLTLPAVGDVMTLVVNNKPLSVTVDEYASEEELTVEDPHVSTETIEIDQSNLDIIHDFRSDPGWEEDIW